MEINYSTTAEGLPRVEWEQCEKTEGPDLFFNAIAFGIIAAIGSVPLTAWLDVVLNSGQPWNRGNPIFWVPSLIIAWALLNTVVWVAFIALYATRLNVIGVENDKCIVVRKKRCHAYIASEGNAVWFFCFTQPSGLSRTPNLIQFPADDLISFSIGTPSEWFGGKSSQDCFVIIAQLRDGTPMQVAFDYRGRYVISLLHVALVRSFITNRPRDGWLSKEARSPSGKQGASPASKSETAQPYDDDVI